MAKKGNIRSMRFSDEIIEIIESQAGDTFTAKFEALVTRCMWELLQKEKQLECIQQQISQEQKRLSRIRNSASKLEQNIHDMEWAARNYSTRMKQATDSLEAMMKNM